MSRTIRSIKTDDKKSTSNKIKKDRMLIKELLNVKNYTVIDIESINDNAACMVAWNEVECTIQIVVCSADY